MESQNFNEQLSNEAVEVWDPYSPDQVVEPPNSLEISGVHLREPGNTDAYPHDLNDTLEPFGLSILSETAAIFDNEHLSQPTPISSVVDTSLHLSQTLSTPAIPLSLYESHTDQSVLPMVTVTSPWDRLLIEMIDEAKTQHSAGLFPTEQPTLKSVLSSASSDVLAYRLYHFLCASGPMPLHNLLATFWVQYLVLRVSYP
jgi:hypothetical protein